MKAITVANLQENLKTYLKNVSKDSEILKISGNNEEEDAVVIMSIREYNSIKETEHLMSSKQNHLRLLKGIEQAKQGLTKEIDLETLLK